MDGLVVCLWFFSMPFCGLFCGHSICHTRVLLLGFE